MVVDVISYNPLWKTLIDKSINRGELAKTVHLSRATVTKMGKGEPVSLTVIERICTALDMPIQAVVEIRSAPSSSTSTLIHEGKKDREENPAEKEA